MIIVGKKDIMKLFVLPSSQNKNNFDYHGTIGAYVDYVAYLPT